MLETNVELGMTSHQEMPETNEELGMTSFLKRAFRTFLFKKINCETVVKQLW